MKVQKVISHLVTRWKIYLAGFLVLLNIGLAGTACGMYNAYTATQAQLDQANLVIDARIAEIQEFDARLGRANSELARRKDLTEKYEDEIRQFQKEIDRQTDKIKGKSLQIQSRDETIAALKGQVAGGKSVVGISDGSETKTSWETIVDVQEICGGAKLSYRWSDSHQRFELFDPDISESGNENFQYRQLIRVKGLVLTDKSGNVQVKKITAEEVVRIEEEEQIKYVPVKDGEVVLVDSKFEYTNESPSDPKRTWLDPITLRPVVGFDLPYFTPSVGMEIINLGRWIPYGNIGIIPKLSFDLDNWQESRVGIGFTYQLVPPLVDTNIGLGLSLSTPFNDLGRLMLSVDLTFYLTRDLFSY